MAWGAVIVASAALLSACSSTDPNAATAGYVSGDGSIQVLDVGARNETPDITGTTLQGAPFDLSVWRGKIVVVNFWGSWCEPCATEATGLELAYQATKAQGVQFLGVAIRDSQTGALNFQKTYDVSYPSLLDDGSIVLDFRGNMSVGSTPTTYVLDKQGRIAARVLGEVDKTTLIGMIQQVESGKAA
jgi:peroxiredoxin